LKIEKEKWKRKKKGESPVLNDVHAWPIKGVE
jgi:hypothetical protein